MFDDSNLVSSLVGAGDALAEQTGCATARREDPHQRAAIKSARTRHRSYHADRCMCARYCIDDIDMLRRLVALRLLYAPSTLKRCCGVHLRHARQLESCCANTCCLVSASDLLPALPSSVFIDIDSLLRPVYTHAKQAPPTRTPKSPANRSCARALAASHHYQHRCSRRDRRMRYAPRANSGKRPRISPKRSAPPAPPSQRPDPGPCDSAYATARVAACVRHARTSR